VVSLSEKVADVKSKVVKSKKGMPVAVVMIPAVRLSIECLDDLVSLLGEMAVQLEENNEVIEGLLALNRGRAACESYL